MLSPGVSAEGAAGLAERIRAAAGAYEHAGVGTVTASFGVAQHHAAETPDEVFTRADEALYRAKEVRPRPRRGRSLTRRTRLLAR